MSEMPFSKRLATARNPKIKAKFEPLRCHICGSFRPKPPLSDWHKIFPNGSPGVFLVTCSRKCFRALSTDIFGDQTLSNHPQFAQYDEECIPALAAYVTSIGDKPLFSYTREEIIGLIMTVRIAFWGQYAGGNATDDEIPF